MKNVSHEERCAWWAALIGAAADLETASYSIKDPDASRIAKSGAEYYRKRANQLVEGCKTMWHRKFISRVLLVCILPVCVWTESDRNFWITRFKNGGF